MFLCSIWHSKAALLSYELGQEKTSLQGFLTWSDTNWAVKSHRRLLETWNSGFKKCRSIVNIQVAKTKMPISFLVTASMFSQLQKASFLTMQLISIKLNLNKILIQFPYFSLSNSIWALLSEPALFCAPICWFHIEEEGLYYVCSKNKGADQLHGWCEAYLHICFRISKKPVFSLHGLYVHRQRSVTLDCLGLWVRTVTTTRLQQAADGRSNGE